MIESPSGPKRAERTSPRRNVIRWKTTSGGASSFIRLVAKYQPPHPAPAMATMKRSVSRSGETRRGTGTFIVGWRAVVRTVAGIAEVTGRTAVADVRRAVGSGCMRSVVECAAEGLGTLEKGPGVH